MDATTFLDTVLSKALLFAPGESCAYSNVGYMLLLDILERVTGQTFARVPNDFVITPLALQRTSALERTDDLTQYVPGFSSQVTADRNIADVRGRVAPATLAWMLTLVPLPGPHESGMVICGRIGVHSDCASRRRRNFHYGGGGPGYDLSVAVYPDTSLGHMSIAVFVNSSCGPRGASGICRVGIGPTLRTATE